LKKLGKLTRRVESVEQARKLKVVA